MQHIIHTQVISLAVGRHMDAFSVQNDMSRYYYRYIRPVLDRVFTELSFEEEIIQVGKMEIDLREIPLPLLEKGQWEVAIEESIREQVRSFLEKERNGPAVARYSTRQHAARQWLFYLQKGYLPWDSVQTGESWQHAVLEALATEYKLAEQFTFTIVNNPNALFRLALEHNDDFLLSLYSIIYRIEKETMAELVTDLLELLRWYVEQIRPVEISYQSLHAQCWIQIFSRSRAEQDIAVVRNVIENILTKYIKGQDLPALAAAMQERRGLVYQVIQELNREAANYEKRGVEAGNALDENVLNDAAEPAQIVPEEENETDAGIFACHAGLVLLHPFLPALFEKLGLLSANDFVDAAARMKGVMLLNWLARGEEGGAEYEWVIPKYLCSWPTWQAISLRDKLRPEDKQSADEMLAAVIEHWDKLGHTSMAGLRETFLQRRGRLQYRNEKRYLQVDQESIDVLLDYLPWSLSIVKLPWMKELLWVEWR